ncbi:peptidase M61 [Candidatus Tenderia electrophaga]|jgi:predicted metalloprotease with PDZ domain|uniref:Peptidase M61 n=1 Tax=Candidatus Tenderia electrophaga TaxID=1748243 RepID=A0A0S2THN9_9GAMM|nr:peptidase M61 [Candidatus Tenderia electrophaga]
MHYQIVAADPAAHLFQISCQIAKPDPIGQVVSLPAWIPGSYMVRDFAKNIVNISAYCRGESVPLEKFDKATWRAAPCSGPLLIEYEVYAWDLSVRTAHLDQTHAYFNGTSVFLRVWGQDDIPCTVELLPPQKPVIGHWRVATTLQPAGAECYAFGVYQAENYDELIDHPVEMADFTLASFSAGGVPHDVVLTGKHGADMDRLCVDLAKICQTHIDLFGELPPMERYLFQAMVVGDGYGGLEHRSSTSLLISREDLPRKGEGGAVSDDYRTFLGLCSHEYFHTWNIKRIKPAAFLPYELQSESYTQQLWAFEGITSYYDDLALVRSGCITPQAYLQALAQTITRVRRTPGRFKQSVAESSFDAWTKFYRQDENAPNAIVSYYSKGSLIALALDLILRRNSDGATSLDDLMRRLWLDYGKPAIGVPEGEIERLASELAGTDLSDFFGRYVHGTEDPPLAELLESVGVEFILRPAESVADSGGKASSLSIEQLAARPYLGVKTAAEAGNLKLANVFTGSAAMQAGLSAGDVLIALDGLKVTTTNLEKLLRQYRIGATVEIHAFRRDELMTFQATLQAPPQDTVELRMLPDIDPGTEAKRKHWLTR